MIGGASRLLWGAFNHQTHQHTKHGRSHANNSFICCKWVCMPVIWFSIYVAMHRHSSNKPINCRNFFLSLSFYFCRLMSLCIIGRAHRFVCFSIHNQIKSHIHTPLARKHTQRCPCCKRTTYSMYAPKIVNETRSSFKHAQYMWHIMAWFVFSLFYIYTE